VFLAEGNVEGSLAFFDKVVDIWFKYLNAMRLSGRPKANTALISDTSAGIADMSNKHKIAVANAHSAATESGSHTIQELEQLTEVLSNYSMDDLVVTFWTAGDVVGWVQSVGKGFGKPSKTAGISSYCQRGSAVHARII
jgi:hypothetical protein